MILEELSKELRSTEEWEVSRSSHGALLKP